MSYIDFIFEREKPTAYQQKIYSGYVTKLNSKKLFDQGYSTGFPIGFNSGVDVAYPKGYKMDMVKGQLLDLMKGNMPVFQKDLKQISYLILI